MSKLLRDLIVAFLAVTSVVIVLSAIAAVHYRQRPTITRALDLIQALPERIPVNSPAVFKLKASAAAQRIAKRGVVVRIFSLSADQKTPAALTQIDGCDVYLSVPYKLVPAGVNEIKFQAIDVLDESWLNLSNSLRSVEPGRYYFVFEQADSDSSGSEQFRIKSSDALAYFKTGFRITIETHEEISAKSLRHHYLEREANLGRLKIEVDSEANPVPCYSYERVVVQAHANDPVRQGILQACLTEASKASLSG